ncbi:MAG: DUF2065 domain-containing protein [Alphaproteobacteria bacterium]|nr:DUF2065 domain-containing protein [Alphaproteobacteria bacterium]
MESLSTHLLLAFALIFVIEGLLYAVFPLQIQRMMAMASILPKDKFRNFGAAMIAFGIILVWLFQKII